MDRHPGLGPGSGPGNGVSQRDLNELERRVRIECQQAIIEAVTRLERATEQAISRLAQTIEDRRSSGRWWAGFAVSVLVLLTTIAIGALR